VVMTVRLDGDIRRGHREAVVRSASSPSTGSYPASQWRAGRMIARVWVRTLSSSTPRNALERPAPPLTGHGGPEVIEWGVYAVETEASA
jgi:hypothetical protein